MENGNGILLFILLVFLVMYSPAIILLIIGLIKLKKQPERAKTLLILAGVYVIVGLGICGMMYLH